MLLRPWPYTNTRVQHLQVTIGALDENPEAAKKIVVGFLLNQMTAKARIKKHEQAAIDALLKEFAQVDNQDIFDPLDATKLSKSWKKAVLHAINLINEK